MRGQDINLRHLRAFSEVCAQGGISAAADIVHLSQPAITQAISKLEADLGALLFVRSSRGMFPTDAGRALQYRAARALEFLAIGAGNSKRRGGRDYASLVTNTQLRALIAVAGHGNFSVAARAVGVSQPSLYKAARDLEALSQQSFYQKTQKGISLTQEAETMLRFGRLALAELDQAVDDISYQMGVDTGVLKLGSLPLARSSILPDALNQMTAAHPRLQIQVVDSSYDEMLHSLRNGGIDLMLGALRDPDPAPDVHQQPLFTNRLGIFCRAGHPLLSIARPDKHDLAKYPWVVPQKGAPTRTYFDEFFSDVPDDQMGQILESNSPILVRGLLSGSDRLTMISTTQVRVEVTMCLLSRLPIDLNDPARPIGITTRDSWSPTVVQKTFVNTLHALAAKIESQNDL